MTTRTPCPFTSSRFRQQDLPASRPFLTPGLSAVIFGLLSLVTFILGAVVYFLSKALFSLEIPYNDQCHNSTVCTLNFTIHQNVSGHFFVYYALTKICQSTFLYSASKNWNQLRGRPYTSAGALSNCNPLVTDDNGSVYVPCGILPHSVFTDNFRFSDEFPNLISNNTAQSRFQELFRKPDTSYDSVGVKWLNETLFPDGQIDDRFVTWMDLAPFSNFRKLWGETSADAVLEAGNYSVEIENNYEVETFDGNKSLIIAQVFWVGGQNPFFGIVFFIVAGCCAVSAVLLAVVHCRKVLPLYKSLARFTEENQGRKGRLSRTGSRDTLKAGLLGEG